MSAAETLHHPASPRRHRFTVESFHAMGRTGILAPDARIELIEGELYDMSPIDCRHALLVNRIAKLLNQALPDRYYVSSQGPIFFDEENQPQPDAAIIDKPESAFWSRLPRAAETLLIIEVADATLKFDRTEKARLYARAGIPEYWVIDIDHKAVHVHRGPDTAKSVYQEIREVAGDGELRPANAPAFHTTVNELFA